MTAKRRHTAEWRTLMRCLHALDADSRYDAPRRRIRRPPARFCLWGGRSGDIWIGGYADGIYSRRARTAARTVREQLRFDLNAATHALHRLGLNVPTTREAMDNLNRVVASGEARLRVALDRRTGPQP